MFDKLRSVGEKLGVVKKERQPLIVYFYAYVYKGALTLGQLLHRADIKDVQEFTDLTQGLQQMIDRDQLDQGALFRANQLINLVNNKNLETEIRNAKGERVIGNRNI